MRSGFAAGLIGAVGLGVLLAAVPASGQQESSQQLALKIGKKRYMKYCSSCHGPEGKGDGVAAHLFTKKPTNLTLLSKENGGKFPMNELINIVKGGEPIAAHGKREMPVWGEMLGHPLETTMYGQDEEDAEVVSIGLYLKSIQVK